jgi:uncharacterized protein YcfL
MKALAALLLATALVGCASPTDVANLQAQVVAQGRLIDSQQQQIAALSGLIHQQDELLRSLTEQTVQNSQITDANQRNVQRLITLYAGRR